MAERFSGVLSPARELVRRIGEYQRAQVEEEKLKGTLEMSVVSYLVHAAAVTVPVREALSQADKRSRKDFIGGTHTLEGFRNRIIGFLGEEGFVQVIPQLKDNLREYCFKLLEENGVDKTIASEELQVWERGNNWLDSVALSYGNNSNGNGYHIEKSSSKL